MGAVVEKMEADIHNGRPVHGAIYVVPYQVIADALRDKLGIPPGAEIRAFYANDGIEQLKIMVWHPSLPAVWPGDHYQLRFMTSNDQ